jgi:hypothetical protein
LVQFLDTLLFAFDVKDASAVDRVSVRVDSIALWFLLALVSLSFDLQSVTKVMEHFSLQVAHDFRLPRGTLVVVAQEMKDTVDQQCDHFTFERFIPFAGLTPGLLDRDDHVAEQSRA